MLIALIDNSGYAKNELAELICFRLNDNIVHHFGLAKKLLKENRIAFNRHILPHFVEGFNRSKPEKDLISFLLMGQELISLIESGADAGIIGQRINQEKCKRHKALNAKLDRVNNYSNSFQYN